MLYLLQQYISQALSAITDMIARISDAVSGGDSDATAQDAGTPPAGALIGSVADGNGLLINVYAEEVNGAVNMTVKVMEGVADLRGFYMDVGDSVEGVSVEGVDERDLAIADEGVTTVGSRDNNMNGTGETFDIGMEIGTAGYMRDDNGEAQFTLQGVSLQDLDGLTFGVRATSVGEDRDGAVKLLGEFDIQEPVAEPPAEPPTEPATPPTESAEPPAQPPATGGSFPQLTDDISSIVLVYDSPASDGTYAVQVSDVPYYVEDDLDVWLIDATHYLEVTDPNVDQDSELLGVAITTTNAGDPTQSSTEYYALDGDADIDTAPTSYLTADATVKYDTIIDM
ncbi:MAG TPA: hypothetical protein VFP62_03135 [Burkholderiales bacterium]|jgi:hypothetical protein|nr:hypothetical protein [Burkholderiales bacterium]